MLLLHALLDYFHNNIPRSTNDSQLLPYSSDINALGTMLAQSRGYSICARMRTGCGAVIWPDAQYILLLVSRSQTHTARLKLIHTVYIIVKINYSIYAGQPSTSEVATRSALQPLFNHEDLFDVVRTCDGIGCSHRPLDVGGATSRLGHLRHHLQQVDAQPQRYCRAVRNWRLYRFS